MLISEIYPDITDTIGKTFIIYTKQRQTKPGILENYSHKLIHILVYSFVVE